MSDPVLQFSLRGGIDRNTDPRSLPPGAMTSLINLVWPTEGEYATRNGFVEVHTGHLTSIKRLAVFADELLAVDETTGGATLYSVTPATGGFVSKGLIAEPKVTYSPAFGIPQSITAFASATVGNLEVYAWIDSRDTFSYAIALDATTHAVVLPPTLLGNATALSLRLCVAGTYIVWAVELAATSIWARAVNASSPTPSWSTVEQISATGAAGPAFALAGISAVTPTFAVTYEIAGNNIHTVTYSPTNLLVPLASVTTAMGAGVWKSMASVGTAGETLWIAASGSFGGNATVVVGLDPSTLATTTAVTSILTGIATDYQLGIERVNATTAMVVTSSESAGTYFRQVTTGAATLGPLRPIPNVTLAVGPFAYGGHVYALVTRRENDGGTFYYGGTISGGSSHFLVDLQAADTTTTNLAIYRVATLMPRIAKDFGNTSAPCTPIVTSLSTGKFLALAPSLGATQARLTLERLVFDFASGKRWTSLQSGNLLALGSEVYDGHILFDDGFPWAPDIVGGSTGAGNIESGTYSWVVCYEWLDGSGNMHRSEASVPVPPAVHVNEAVTLTVSTCTLSRRMRALGADGNTPIFITVYRARFDGPGGFDNDGVYRRVTTEPFPSANANNPLVATVDVVDNVKQADVDANPSIYPVAWFEGGVKQPWTPPSFVHQIAHKNRRVGVGDDERTIWMSTAFSPGEAVWFHPDFTFTLQDTNDAVTALASLDDRLLIFTRTAIYFVYGDGPTLTGQSDLSNPAKIPTGGIGCIDWRSIAIAPDGIYFQSARGLECLQRGQTLVPFSTFGSLVDPLTNGKVCSSACVVAPQAHIRWSFSAEETNDAANDGLMVVWDYELQRFTTFVMQQSVAPNASGALVRAAVIHPAYGHCVAIQVSGQAYVRKETPGAYLDGTAMYATRFETGWIAAVATNAGAGPGGPQGWQSVRRVGLLAEWKSSHGLFAEFAYNFADFAETHTYDEATLTALTATSTLESLMMVPGYHRCSAVRLRVTTTLPVAGATGQHASFYGVALEIRPKAGGFKNAPAGARS